MARAIWTGSVTFGLVNVPVRMYAGISSARPRFHQIDRDTGERVRHQKVSAESGREVDADDVVKGYEVEDGAYVLVEPDELDALAAEHSRALEIECFVVRDEIDPAAWSRFYYLGPGEEGRLGRGYALLVRALEESERAGIARFVWHGREHLAALRSVDGVLALDTLRYAHEIRTAEEVLDTRPDLGDVGKRDLDLALRLISEMTEPWDHAAWKDTWTREVQALLEKKCRGEKTTVDRSAERSQSKVIDFTEALERSLEQRGHGRRHGRRKMLRALSKKELYEKAAEADITGRSRMTKVELIDALRKKHAEAS